VLGRTRDALMPSTELFPELKSYRRWGSQKWSKPPSDCAERLGVSALCSVPVPMGLRAERFLAALGATAGGCGEQVCGHRSRSLKRLNQSLVLNLDEASFGHQDVLATFA
jgi:hypothetical protein